MDLEAFFQGTEKYKGQIRKAEIAWMESLYEKSKEQDRCFLFLREQESEKFVELYHWQKRGGHRFETYIIGEGHIMGAHKRVRFDLLCTGKAILDGRTIKKVIDYFSEKQPGLYLKNYEDPLLVLHHLYCTLNRQKEEVFYKAGLEMIGLYLNFYIYDYNMLGTTPGEIMDMPVKLLRVFNSRHGMKLLATEARRQYLTRFFHQAPSLFARKWTYAQCEYVCAMLEKEVALIDSNEQRDVILYLQRYDSVLEYERYMEYRRYRDRLAKKIAFPMIPDLRNGVGVLHFDLFDVIDKMEYLCEALFEKNEEMDAALYVQYQRQGKYLEYENDTYLLRYPHSIEELIRESEYQHNCLWTYQKSDLLACSVLFLRKKSRPEVPFVDVEVKYNEITQAKGRYNMDVSDSVMEFLETYAQEKVLEMVC